MNKNKELNELNDEEKVAQLLAQWYGHCYDKYQIVEKLRKLVVEIAPNIHERVIYGGIMFSLENDFGGDFVSKKHVSLEFGQGYQMTNPTKRLEGTGKFRRHLKFRQLSDIEESKTRYFIEQAVELLHQ